MKKILSMLIVFVVSVCNVFGAISKQGIEEAIREGKLGEYLILKNDQDAGIQQFLRHCEKHFCDPRNIAFYKMKQVKLNEDRRHGRPVGNNPVIGTSFDGNNINNYHTVLGNGDWGHDATYTDALRWILNAVRHYEFKRDPENNNQALRGYNLVIDLNVAEVPEIANISERHTKHTFTFNKKNKAYQSTSDAMKSKFNCTIKFNGAINGIRNNGGNDGAAGWCYVAG